MSVTPNIANENSVHYGAGEQMIVGEKLPNPFSIENMWKAYYSLVEKAKSSKVMWIYPPEPVMEEILDEPTNKYIRILPTDEAAYTQLKELQNVNIFDFPLDHEMAEGGNYYHDPSLPDTVITWQYTVLKNNEFIPISIGQQQILNTDIFLYENSPYYPNYDEAFWEALEDEALLLTNATYYMRTSTPTTTLASKWTPSGRIMIKDDQLGYDVGLEGAKVMIKKFWRHEAAYTNANGYFTSGKQFRGKVDYSIKWESNQGANGWDIRSGWYVQAYTDGPNNKEGSWNRTLHGTGNDELEIFYGSIHRGVYDVLVKDPFGLYKGLLPRLKIGGMNKNGTGITLHVTSIVAGPDIRIYRKDDNGNIKPTLQVYGTTAHEVGHSIQRSYGPMKFVTGSGLIRESWANAVEWAFCNWRYNNNNIYTTNSSMLKWYYCNDFLNIKTDDDEGSIYTPLFIDLMDNIPNNSLLKLDGITDRTLNDNVGGYTLVQISNALRYKGWLTQPDKVLEDIENYLIDNYTNSTENNIGTYFDEYNTYNYPNR
ncbi:MAG: hypothetical protein H6553_03890 [Chitinophagales bacterium]|nr:hypothetical protein [Chitinophagales bacterium]